MTKTYRAFAFFSCFLLTQLTTNAQQLKDIQQAFNLYQEAAPQEKLFIHTDKDQYITGEIIWFKAYCVNASGNILADLSKVAYIDILDHNNKPISQSKISLKSGTGNGSIQVPSTLVNGSYKLRAYTKWMQNFGPDLFFEKQINLLNTLSSPEAAKKVSSEQDLRFFPEGGDMIEGIPANIGFKVVGADGLGIDIKGVIVNQKNDTVAQFQTLKFGIGRFTFTPMPNQTYKAVASSTHKEIIIKELPAAKKTGYAMSLADDGGEQLNLTISSNLNTQRVFLFVHNGKQTTVAENLSLTNGKSQLRIDKKKLGEGISHLTVFNENGQAVSERLYFKMPQQQLKIEASSDFMQYGTRKKVNVHLSLKDEQNQPQSANLSLSVRRIDSLQAMSETDIMSYLWLSSELKGHIESPAYYFLQNDKDSRQALDNLLLTQGWRRFKWDEVLKAKTPSFTFLPEVNGHLITGKIVDHSGLAQRGINVFLGVPGKRVQFYTAESDSLGRFAFNTKDFYGSNEIVVQTNTELDTTSLVSIQSPFAEQFSTFDYKPFNIKPSLLQSLQKYSFGTQVQNAYSSAQLKRFYDPGIDSSLFYGKPYKTYKPKNYTAFNTVEEVLREYVSETFVSKRQKNFQIKVLSKTGDLLSGDPLVLLDGTPFFNLNKVMTANPNLIDKIEVVRDKYYYGSAYFEGILNFSSYKGNLADVEIAPTAIILDYEGMQLQREFYSPTYENEAKLKSRLPDLRSTIFWQPEINIKKEGSASLDFYTSDFTGTYLVEVQGISDKGIPGSKYIRFEVKK